MNYTEIGKLIKDLIMETFSSPFLRFCMGIALIVFAFALFFALGGGGLAELIRAIQGR